MVRYLKFWNYWFTKLFNFHIFTVIFSYWNAWIYDIRKN